MKISQRMLALVVSVVALPGAGCQKPPPPSFPPVMASPPELPPASVAACAGSADASSLAELMRNRFNPLLTSISFALHHEDAELSDRMGAVSDATSVLLGCVQDVTHRVPPFTLRETGEFYHFLDRLQDTALALEMAAVELDEADARHWFAHLKHECAACHARFRKE